MPTPVAPTGTQTLDALLWGWKWDTPNLTVSFPSSIFAFQGYTNIEGFQPFTQFQVQQIVNFGLNNLGVFSNLSFSAAPNEFGNLRFAQAARIDYGQSAISPGLHIPGGRGSAEANPPDANWIPGYAQGDNWFTVGAYQNPVLGSFQYAAGLLHEVGHSLGLKHGHTSQQWSNANHQNPVFPALPGNVDSQEFSIMTYRSHVGVDLGKGASGQEEYPWTYMMLDLAALQYMYGANFGAGSNENNSTYRFNAQTGEMSVNGFGFGGSYNAKILLTIWDGGGIDHYDFSNYHNDQTISLRAGEFSAFSQAQLSNLSLGSGSTNLARGNIANPLLYQGDLRSLIENVSTGAGADRIQGNQINNVIKAGAGFDTVFAGEGNDIVFGGDGRDLVFLNQGNDLFNDNGQGGINGQDTVFGGLGNDSLQGGNGADVLHGEAGNDLIFGRLGNDLIFGGDQYDTIQSGEGNDTVEGGNGRDRVFLNQGNDLFNDNSQGGENGRDTVFGGFGADTVEGGNGADEFHGEWGNDLIFGRLGNDLVFGGDNFDTIHGGDGNDTVFGGKGQDRIFLGNGADRYVDTNQGGALGNDTITGGAGADTFVFGTAVGADVITDFTRNQDGLEIATGLVGGRNAAQVVSQLASVQGGDVVLDFGSGQSITLEGLTSTAGLENDLLLI